MGKAALLTISGFIVIGAIYSFSTDQSALATKERVADFQYETLAKNVAQISYNRVEKKLSEQANAGSYQSVDVSGEHGGMPYDGEATWGSGGDVVSIHAKATAREGESNELVYWMRSRYKKEQVATAEIAEQPPKFMQYAVLAQELLEVDGNVDVEFTADGDEANELNANVHSNTALAVNGGAASVRGYGTSAGPVSAKKKVFDPYDSDGEGTKAYTDPVEIPDFDAADYVSKLPGAADETSSGDVQISGNGDLPAMDGTRKDPFIWHVEGRLDITGDVEIPGYVLLVVDDGFKVAGNVTIGEVDYDSSVESNFGLYTEGSGEIDLKGGGTFYGQVFANNDVDVDVGGNAELYGSITTGGTVKLHGNPFLHYRPASPALTQAWQEMTTQLRMIAYHEGEEK